MSNSLFSVFKTSTLKVFKHELGFAGDWDNTNWRDLNRLSLALVSLESEVLSLPRDAFKTTKVLQFDGANCIPLIACHVNHGASLDPLADEVLSEFISLVTGKLPLNHPQNSESNSSPSLTAISHSHAYEFLKANGNKRLSSEVVVRGPQTQFKITGRFAQKPSSQSSKESTYILEGKVDLLEISGRAFVIVQDSTASKVSIRYDEREHFDVLHSLLGCGVMATFKVREIRSGQKVSVELVEICSGAIDNSR